jgi:ABC-type Fe3+/spermidine/putrescine transport system ATPase subunit
LSQPDQGQIELHGRDVTYLTPQERHVGFVFQNYAIFSHMTVAENIAFGLRIRKKPLAEQKERAAELMDIVGLAGLGERYTSQLSGGQQQRVALARALAYEPAVILLDEPFGALDVKIRAQLRQSFKAIQRRLNVTTILVTHDQEEAFELADRIGVVERGNLLEVGTPETLYYRPRMEFTAAFIGGGNVLVGRTEGKAVRLGSIRLPLPPEAPPHDDYATTRIVFRPESVALTPDNIAPDGTGPKGMPDGVVDAFDYAFWKSNFGNTLDGGTGQWDATTVPEPTAACPLLLAVVLGFGARSQRVNRFRRTTACSECSPSA